jgi:tetratricopeptide (TPR) repeat protein
MHRAYRAFQRAIGIVPWKETMESALLDQASELYLAGHYREALALYMQALVQDPDNPRVHCGLGEVLEALARPGEALVAFDQALLLDPSWVWAHFGRGGVLQGLRRYDEAAAAFAQAGELDPQEPAFHRALGVVHYLRDDLTASLRAYRRALRSEPEDALSHYGLGLGYDAQGQPKEALASYLQASACDPQDPWPHLRLAGLLRRQGIPGDEHYLQQAAALLPTDDECGQAIVALLQGDAAKALRHVQQTIATLPESADWLARDPDLEPLQADERFWLILSAGRRHL